MYVTNGNMRDPKRSHRIPHWVIVDKFENFSKEKFVVII